MISPIIEIPLQPSIASYEFTTQIGNRQYVFRVRWNGRAEAWYFDVLEGEDLQPIATGLRISLGLAIGRYVQHRLFTTGAFLAFDLTRQGREATFDDLGARVVLSWIPVEEQIFRHWLAAGPDLRAKIERELVETLEPTPFP
jgi:hypothetical protein